MIPSNSSTDTSRILKVANRSRLWTKTLTWCLAIHKSVSRFKVITQVEITPVQRLSLMQSISTIREPKLEVPIDISKNQQRFWRHKLNSILTVRIDKLRFRTKKIWQSMWRLRGLWRQRRLRKDLTLATVPPQTITGAIHHREALYR